MPSAALFFLPEIGEWIFNKKKGTFGKSSTKASVSILQVQGQETLGRRAKPVCRLDQTNDTSGG